jgi:hypothetical protein
MDVGDRINALGLRMNRRRSAKRSRSTQRTTADAEYAVVYRSMIAKWTNSNAETVRGMVKE